MKSISTAIATLLLSAGLASAADYTNLPLTVVYNVSNTEFWAQLDNAGTSLWCRVKEDLVGTMNFERMYSACLDAVVSGQKISVITDDANNELNVTTLSISN
jgi:hypothetical protein